MQLTNGYRYLRSRVSIPVALHYGTPTIDVAQDLCEGFVVSGGASAVMRQGRTLGDLEKVFWLQLVGTGITATLTLILSLPGALVMALFLDDPQRMYNHPSGQSQLLLSLSQLADINFSQAVPSFVAPSTPAQAASTRIAWAAFAPDQIPKLVAQGQVVLVDVTADWCLTCRVNERLVLSRDGVAAALAAPNVIAMRADWTNPDPRIAAFLARFGRYGIPFNVVMGPGAPAGTVLPELLTEDAVLAALKHARAP